MPNLTRRRFLSISATLACVPLHGAFAAPEIIEWHGIALGAEAAIFLSHPDAPALIARATAEIARLETIFSLYEAGSALSRLNAAGRLDAPPFELLECLALCSRVHRATEGRFDPTIQPLWKLYAIRYSAGLAPSPDDIAAVVTRVGFDRVVFDNAAVILAPGTELTLNGVAQGFIADRLAQMLTAEGLTDILIDTGEFRALGRMPGAEAWPVTLASGGQVALAARALATSSPRGTVFDAAGQVGHILDPATGTPAPSRWTSISISASSAGLADALSTAACLMPDRNQIATALAHFPDARLEALA
jgi:FAD:protein FMN transferase